jgi:hypothetical protein
MFSGPIVWRGIIYSILMLISKLLCGAWLIRLSLSISAPAVLRRSVRVIKAVHVPHLWHGKAGNIKAEAASRSQEHASTVQASITTDNEQDAITTEPLQSASPPTKPDIVSHSSPPGPNPVSLYPAAILGLAMVARGEIGFLISSLAESNGIFSAEGNEQVFLIVTWAIVLCTIVGPVCVGLLVRRVRKLEKARGEGARDVLGVWGVE